MPGTIASYAYTLDASGHRTSVMEASGRVVNYGYDNLYRLTSETIAGDAHNMNGAVSYVYDPVGNRTQKTSTLPGYPGGLSNYNANDQLTNDTYDADGNTTQSLGVGYVYDFENHLLQAGSVSYVYDGDGNRIVKTVAGATTRYTIDPRSMTGYPEVLSDWNSEQGHTGGADGDSSAIVAGKLQRVPHLSGLVQERCGFRLKTLRNVGRLALNSGAEGES